MRTNSNGNYLKVSELTLVTCAMNELTVSSLAAYLKMRDWKGRLKSYIKRYFVRAES